MRRGRFIVIEGIDGSGSTTQARALVQALQQRGQEAVLTWEPTPGPIGALIRQVLSGRLGIKALEGGMRPLDWRTMALLFAADRCDHNDALIRPLLERGVVVVCDRYTLSSLAYQTVTADASDAQSWIESINSRALPPDLTLVLQVEPEVAARRRALRGGETELYEVEALQRKLAAFYARARALLPGHVVDVDANVGLADVTRAVLAEFDAAYPRDAPQ